MGNPIFKPNLLYGVTQRPLCRTPSAVLELYQYDSGGFEAVEVGDGAGGGISADILGVDHIPGIKFGQFFAVGENIKRIARGPGQRALVLGPAAKSLEFVFAMIKNHAGEVLINAVV